MTNKQPEAATGSEDAQGSGPHPIYDEMVRGALGAVVRDGAGG